MLFSGIDSGEECVGHAREKLEVGEKRRMQLAQDSYCFEVDVASLQNIEREGTQTHTLVPRKNQL